MSGAGSDADSLRRDDDLRASPTYRATLKETLDLRSKAIKIIERQVADLKGVRTTAEETELLEHIDLCISIATRLSRYANACIRDPASMNDPAFRSFLIDAALLLSQHEDEPGGG